VKSGKERRAKSEGEKVGRHPEASYPGRRTCKAFQTHPAARLLETGRFLLFYSVPIVSGVRRRWRDRQVQSNSKCSSMRVQNAKPGGVDELRVCRVGAIHVIGPTLRTDHKTLLRGPAAATLLKAAPA